MTAHRDGRDEQTNLPWNDGRAIQFRHSSIDLLKAYSFSPFSPNKKIREEKIDGEVPARKKRCARAWSRGRDLIVAPARDPAAAGCGAAIAEMETLFDHPPVRL